MSHLEMSLCLYLVAGHSHRGLSAHYSVAVCSDDPFTGLVNSMSSVSIPSQIDAGSILTYHSRRNKGTY